MPIIGMAGPATRPIMTSGIVFINPEAGFCRAGATKLSHELAPPLLP
jgi:hypothetical protein